MLVRIGRAVGTVVAVIAVIIRGCLMIVAIVVMVMIVAAALMRVPVALRLDVGMVHREHATPEPGDHAEHQQPWKRTAHDAQKTAEFLFCKPKASGGLPADPAFLRRIRR